ncbi:radical SAM protein [Candidatus Sumerlaeota bacterium]|nr:radical SAM protein [Candidatus Sumerlaeota bacterium]
MMKILEYARKGPILRHPLLPCLSSYHTINLTNGCPNRCVYCYAQSYGHHPGWDKVVFYSNTLDLLKTELPRKRQTPRVVYFSTASEPFLPIPPILDQMFDIMRLLLDNGIYLLISTKCLIPDHFIKLFARFPGKVHVQVGMTTTDDAIRALIEPNAATVEERLGNLRRLVMNEVRAELRMDPLIPELTDSMDSFISLLEKLAETGAKNAVTSYLFMRYGIDAPKKLKLGEWSFYKMAKRLYTCRVTDYCGHGVIWIPDTEYRRRKYALLKEIAQANDITLHLCRCKNKDLTSECCHPQDFGNPEQSQLSLLE